MTTPDDAVTIAVLAREVELLRETVTTLTAELREQRLTYVSVNLWQQRNVAVDDKFAGMGREIGELRVELKSRRVSWTSVVASVAGLGSLLVVLMDRIARSS